MKKIILHVFLGTFLTYSYASTWYVNLNATGANNGTSWTDAFTDLQDAIAASSFGDQIWVAQGTYKTTSTTDRQIYFEFKSGTQAYGGFTGTETMLSQRDYVNNITTLSGEIGTGASNDNSYHVIQLVNVSNLTKIDGFTITGGYAGNGIIGYGGGIYMTNSSPTIQNCNFLGNFASNSLEGSQLQIWILCNPQIIGCTFIGNTNGYVIYTISPTYLKDCYFLNNEEGIYSNKTLDIDRCVFAGNYSTQINLYGSFINSRLSNSLFVGNVPNGELIRQQGALSDFSMFNCTIAANYSLDSLVVLSGTNSEFSNNIIWGNTANVQLNSYGSVSNSIVEGGYPGGINILNTDPLFDNPGTATSVPSDTTGVDYHLQLMSLAIDYGSNASVIGTMDLDSLTRIQNVNVDLGAYESNYCTYPVAILPGAPYTICNGNPVLLSSSGGIQFLWSNGSTNSSINVSSPGNYILVSQDTAGCRGSAQATVNTSSSPNPSITYSGGDLQTGSFTTYQWLYEGDTIVGATSDTHLPSEGYGTYSVQVTNSGGCAGTDTYCYSPAAFFASGPTTFCNGDSVILWITGGTGFAWSNSETDSSITVFASGNYSVTVQSTIAGCSVDFQQTVTVNPNPTPVVTYSTGAFHTTSFNSYQWYFNGSPIVGATSMNHTPTNGTGQYSVVVTNSFGCTGTSNVYNFFLGLDENDQLDISIYPNPVLQNGIIYIKSSNSALTNITINVLDMSGKQILNKAFENIPNSIPFDGIKPGVYMLSISGGHAIKNYRIIVL